MRSYLAGVRVIRLDRAAYRSFAPMCLTWLVLIHSPVALAGDTSLATPWPGPLKRSEVPRKFRLDAPNEAEVKERLSYYCPLK